MSWTLKSLRCTADQMKLLKKIDEASKVFSSKKFLRGQKLSKKRTQKSADEDTLQAMKKPEKKAKKKKSKKAIDQATANNQVDQDVSSDHSVFNLEAYSKDEDILINKHAATDNLVKETKKADIKGNERDVVTDIKH